MTAASGSNCSTHMHMPTSRSCSNGKSINPSWALLQVLYMPSMCPSDLVNVLAYMPLAVVARLPPCILILALVSHLTCCHTLSKEQAAFGEACEDPTCAPEAGKLCVKGLSRCEVVRILVYTPNVPVGMLRKLCICSLPRFEEPERAFTASQCEQDWLDERRMGSVLAQVVKGTLDYHAAAIHQLSLFRVVFSMKEYRNMFQPLKLPQMRLRVLRVHDLDVLEGTSDCKANTLSRLLNSCSSITELSVSGCVLLRDTPSLMLSRFARLRSITLADVTRMNIVPMLAAGLPESLESFDVRSGPIMCATDLEPCARQLCACPRLQTLRIDDEKFAEAVLRTFARLPIQEQRGALKRIRMRLPCYMHYYLDWLRLFAHLQEVDIVAANVSRPVALGIDIVQTMTALSQLPRLTRMEVAVSCSRHIRTPFAWGTDKDRGEGGAEGGPRLEVLRLSCLQIEEPLSDCSCSAEVCQHRLCVHRPLRAVHACWSASRVPASTIHAVQPLSTRPE